MRRWWTYCTICVGRLERGEQVQQDYPGEEFRRALRIVAPPVVPRLKPRRRGGQRRLEPTTPVDCNHYACMVPLKTCLQRQDAKWPGKPAALYEWCGSGRCKQGAEYWLRANYDAAADWAGKSKAGRASYQFFRQDASLQRRKRRLQMLSRPEGGVPTIDRPPGVPGAPAGLDLEDPDVRGLLGG